MGPVIHTSLIPLCMDLWKEYDIYSGWGFDKVLCDLTKEDAAVIHCSQMYHPKKISSYDKSNAFAEMDKLLTDVFPKFMKDVYEVAKETGKTFHEVYQIIKKSLNN